MRKVSSKNAAIIAMVISVGSFALLAAAFIVSVYEVPRDKGVSLSFALWIYSVMAAMFGLLFYSIDAVVSAKKIFQNIHPIFNTVLVLALIGAIPMLIYFGAAAGIENICIWTAYYLMVFVLEVISIVKHVKMQREDERQQKRFPMWWRR